MQSFGGPWTLLKLDVLEKYLHFFVHSMKNQKFKLCYIDAFAGSGDVDVYEILKTTHRYFYCALL